MFKFDFVCTPAEFYYQRETFTKVVLPSDYFLARPHRWKNEIMMKMKSPKLLPLPLPFCRSHNCFHILSPVLIIYISQSKKERNIAQHSIIRLWDKPRFSSDVCWREKKSTLLMGFIIFNQRCVFRQLLAVRSFSEHCMCLWA